MGKNDTFLRPSLLRKLAAEMWAFYNKLRDFSFADPLVQHQRVALLDVGENNSHPLVSRRPPERLDRRPGRRDLKRSRLRNTCL